VEPVSSWTPERDDPDGVFTYIDLSAVDQNDKIIVGAREIVCVEAPSRARQGVREGDILVSTVRPNLNAVARVPSELDGATASTGFCVLRPKVGQLDGQYLYQWVKSPGFVSDMVRKATGASYPAVSDRIFYESQMPLPPLPEQRRIATILDKADELRVKRRAALAKLDTLTQSIFLNMFGDPATNPKGWPIKTLSEFYVNQEEGTKCGPFGSALKKNELESDGVPVWNMDNIDPSGRMVLPFRMWISESKYRELEAYTVANGDVIVSRAGTVGKMCVVSTSGVRSIISTNLIRLRFGPDLLPLYFVSLMTYCKGRVGRLKSGADGALTHMNTGILDTLKLPYPPLEIQREFVVIIESIERQKSRHATQLAEIEMLFTTLQHRAFRGEL
jgi:type I restriction enzyme S subunit